MDEDSKRVLWRTRLRKMKMLEPYAVLLSGVRRWIENNEQALNRKESYEALKDVDKKLTSAMHVLEKEIRTLAQKHGTSSLKKEFPSGRKGRRCPECGSDKHSRMWWNKLKKYRYKCAGCDETWFSQIREIRGTTDGEEKKDENKDDHEEK